MPAEAMIPVEEYLATHFRPDCDYVDGRIEERNVGERDHSRLQALLTFYLIQRENESRIRTLTEQRIRIAEARFRIPDVCVCLGELPRGQVLTSPPFLCVEILSPLDTVQAMESRIREYLDFGVPFVWLIDPRTRRAWIYSGNSREEAVDGVLRTFSPDLSVPVAELFDND
ncbi:MAG: Uma2 family endonuclease [Bryobacteraceae bacterium]|nr:Uma2 family endonuclease [Bryobacteraceae bacterium]